MTTAKRYRSLRREQRMLGGEIFFENHFFPAMSKPPCDDPDIQEYIESRPKFGTVITLFSEDERPVVVDPESIPEGVSQEGMTAALQHLQRMGINVNPKYLEGGSAEETPEEEEGEPAVNTLPTLTYVAKANKVQLQDIIDKNGWTDLNRDATVMNLRDAVREKVREAQQAQ